MLLRPAPPRGACELRQAPLWARCGKSLRCAVLSCLSLAQGEDEAHEVIRQTIIERTPFPATCAAVLRGLGTTK